MKKIIDVYQSLYDEYAKKIGYSVLLIRPALFGAVSVLLWIIVRNFFPEIIVKSEDNNIFELILVVIGTAHSLVAAMQIQSVYNRKINIEIAMRTSNKEILLQNIGFRISKVIKLLLGTFSVIFLYVFMIYPFENFNTGLNVMFIVIFALYLLWEIAVEFDDIFHGVDRITMEEIVEVFGQEIVPEIEKIMKAYRKT